jgi:hypothetical protein
VRLLEAPTVEEVYLAENLTDDIITGRLGVITMAPPGARFFRVRATAALIGRGSAYGAGIYPELDAVLVAAGFTRTLVAGASVTYSPNDDPNSGPLSTMAMMVQQDGKRYPLKYCVTEDFSLSCGAGGFPTAAFSLVGILDGDVTEQALEPASYSNTPFPIWKGAGSLAISGVVNPVPRTFDLNFGLASAPRLDANAADGHGGFRVIGRVPELRVRCEVPNMTDWNPRADWGARTPREIDAQFGVTAAAFSKIAIDIDDARVIGVSSVDDGGMRMYDIMYRVTMPGAGMGGGGGAVECNIVFS